MAKKKVTPEQKENVNIEAAAATYQPNTGALVKATDENAEHEYEGAINLPAPGEYWLNGFMRKDATGNVSMVLEAKHREGEKVDSKDLDRGVLFRNNRKRLKHQPDYTGNIFVDAPGEFALIGVIDESKGGVKYMALEVLTSSENGVADDEKPF